MLQPGTRLAAYEIVSLLGAGGMGEVYRARDTNLGRDVALKTLPDRLTVDPERLARFRREAQVLAALNHPHIGGLYGIEEAGTHRFLVLELIDGETLAARLRRGPLPVDEAVPIALEIAEALQAAHEKGIVHRDLKPANIALTREDRVKVLDFGLAKATDPNASLDTTDPVNSPTITSPTALTGIGVILGTAAYMSPEQAKGRTADKRSDVWAFGCVLFEMLAGTRAFGGDDVSDTRAAVLKSEPPWKALPAATPVAVRSVLEGCLEKDYRQRISDISTAAFVLKRPSAPQLTAADGMPVWRRVVMVLLLLGGLAAAAAIGFNLRTRQAVPAAAVARFGIAVGESMQLNASRGAVAISPDGTRMVFAADGRLYLRELSEFDARPVPGTERGFVPAFSPDGGSIVFWDSGFLKRLPVTGGTPITICQTGAPPFSVHWSEHGIVFIQPGTGIMRVSPNGGTPEMMVAGDGGDLFQGAQLLPDGKSLMFSVARATGTANFWETGEVVVHRLATGQRTTLIQRGTDARYLPTGHLVYMVEGTLMAVRFDVAALRVTSAPLAIVEGIRRSAPSASYAAHLDVSETGVLVYVPGPARAGGDVVFLYDRTGSTTPLKLPPASYAYPRVSPDGTRLAIETGHAKESAVSIYELTGASSLRRLTFGGNNRTPIWSADGRRVAFQSDREGDPGIFWQPVDGGTAERLTRAEPGTLHVPESWSPNGDVFLFSATRQSESTLWTFSLADRQARRFADVTSTASPTNAVFSPDGRWVAYQAGDGSMGEATMYVQPFPPTGTKYEIARGGRPMWSRDGRELFFVPGPGQFAVVSVETRPAFRFTLPSEVPRRFGLAPPGSPRPYDILSDGRFVVVDAANTIAVGQVRQIQVVLNWFEELRSKLPAPE